MDIRQIERLMRSMQSHGVTRLEITEGTMAVTLVREEAQILRVVPQDAPPQAEAAADAPAEKTGGAVDGKPIVSPMVGTFHPRAKEAVKVGSKLRKGDVVCVIEAMKLMNDIVMEEDGEITFVALKDGDMVEFGQIIANYRPL